MKTHNQNNNYQGNAFAFKVIMESKAQNMP